jgi:hypothetical protein
MGMISMFRTPKPRQFKYTPIFYDERKEALKEREKQLKQELGISDDQSSRVSLIKGRIRAGFRRSAKERSKSNLRLIIIFIILVLVAYLIFYY